MQRVYLIIKCTMATDRPIVLIVLCILQFGCNNVQSSSESLDCSDERFNSTNNISTTINGQRELDDFVNNVTSTNDDKDRCIQLSLTGESYSLDIIKIMRMKLGTSGGLVIVGAASNPRVTINCVVVNVSDYKELINNSTLVANVSLVVLDGLLFTECPVPVVLEEVSTVIVQNCVFM